jgi:hypothetical protein
LEDVKRRGKKTYQWVLEGEHNDEEEQNNHHEDNSDVTTTLTTTTTTLSDEDVEWWFELPYTITITGSYLGEEDENVDNLIVNAGLIPQQDLETQEIKTMITM